MELYKHLIFFFYNSRSLSVRGGEYTATQSVGFVNIPLQEKLTLNFWLIIWLV